MDSKVFKYVVALADTGSYARAAKELFITPQGLSSSIKRLESAMGVPLFKGDHDGTVLTDFGRVLYRFSLSFECDYAEMMDEMEKLRRRQSRSISLSVSTGLFNVMSRETILSFNERSETGARVEIMRTMVDYDCEEALRDKACDFALLNNPINHRSLLSVPLHKDMLFLWTSADSPLARKATVRSTDLAGMDLVCLAPNEYVTSRGYASRLLEPPLSCSLYYVDEMIEVLEMAMRRGVSSITPRSHVGSFPHEGYVGVPIEDITWGFSVAYRQDRDLSPWDEEFLAFLGSHATFYC
ncbi:LysR family transcriptional regulator [Arabiibacter massiliensis]|uniref:LysR family transcriptional regulator n=1 Tax=Arabiibacter massiliensis TaxID=1870985 RepID=UPI00155A812C|nr:LysR family transcriptional regulator [Arabiibacter massiliensis]